MTLARINTLLKTILLLSCLNAANAALAKEGSPNLTKKSDKKLISSFPKPSRNFDQINVHQIGFGLGQTFLNGDFNHNGESSITLDAYYNYVASHSFDLLINAHVSKHTFGMAKSIIPGVAIGIKGKAFQFDSFSPFLVGGLGFYFPSVRYSDATKSRKKLVFGTNFGLGTELKLNNRITVGIIGHYHNPFDTKQVERADLDGSYFKLLLTTLYTFK